MQLELIYQRNLGIHICIFIISLPQLVFASEPYPTHGNLDLIIMQRFFIFFSPLIQSLSNENNHQFSIFDFSMLLIMMTTYRASIMTPLNQWKLKPYIHQKLKMRPGAMIMCSASTTNDKSFSMIVKKKGDTKTPLFFYWRMQVIQFLIEEQQNICTCSWDIGTFRKMPKICGTTWRHKSTPNVVVPDTLLEWSRVSNSSSKIFTNSKNLHKMQKER